MENDKKSLNEKTRSLLRAKRRKTNIVLNTLIVIVLLLIVVVTVNVFFGDDKTASKEDAERASALSQSGQEKKDTNTDNQEKVRTSKDKN